MGWTLTVANVPPPTHDPRVLMAEIEEVKERLKLAYQGLATKEILYSAVMIPVRAHNAFIAKEQQDTVWVVKARPPGGPGKAVLVPLLRMTLKAKGPSKPGVLGPVPCPSCKVVFIPVQGTSKWTEAHNVIPASLWFVIVPAAIERLMALVQIPLADQPHKAGLEQYLHGLDYRRKGFADKGARSGATIDLYLATLCRAGADTGGPGASGPEAQTGAQCPACESKHADRSLICRVKSFASRVQTEEMARAAIGNQFLKYLDRHQGAIGYDHSAELITRAVALQVVTAMHDASQRGTQAHDHGDFLKALIRDNWQAFSDAIVTEAIAECAAQTLMS